MSARIRRAGAHTILGEISAERFMREQWHRKAMLLRQVYTEASSIVSEARLFQLACQDDVESRLVVREGSRYCLEHGPFTRARLRRLPATHWTLLVQGLDQHQPEARRLRDCFGFIPQVRLDDVMVSLAAPEGGVGPHFDSYDVFLVQGPGRRRWRYGTQKRLVLDPDQPLKILSRFSPSADHILETGDMLYLPPRYAHDGVAVDRCMTFSVGFRAPGAREIAHGFLDHLADHLDEMPALDERFLDPGRGATDHPGRMPADLSRWVAGAVRQLRWDARTVAHFAGLHLSTPKPNVIFTAPHATLSAAAFRRRVQQCGIVLDPRSILLYDNQSIYLNGVAHRMSGSERAWMVALADRQPTGAAPRTLYEWLYARYCDGELGPGTAA